MLPASTLFLDVSAQRDLWPGGAWPLVDADGAGNVAALFALAASLGIRQGGSRCVHLAGQPPPYAPRHCEIGSDGAAAAAGCDTAQPAVLLGSGDHAAAALDRTHAYYLTTGCGGPPDADPLARAALDHLTAGIRDTVVFGAAIERGLDRMVDACLRRRIRTHVVLDASAPADPAAAQQVIASWKRRGVDALTTATVARLLTRAR